MRITTHHFPGIHSPLPRHTRVFLRPGSSWLCSSRMQNPSRASLLKRKGDLTGELQRVRSFLTEGG